MAKKFPASRFTGYDLLESNIETARKRAAGEGLANATFALKDVATLTQEASFDLVTAFDTVHDQAQPDVLLSGIARALKPGGTYLMADIKASTHLENNLDHPIGTFGYSVSCMHCMTVSLARDGMGLGAMWGEEKAKEMIEAAGLELLGIHQAEGDPLNNFYVARRP
jgi:SAM-dependent methyltransferase